MIKFFKKCSPLISLLLILAVFLSIWKYAFAAPAIAVGCLLFSLSVSIVTILEKHRSTSPQAEARRKIIKDVVILASVIIAIVALGGLAGLIAGSYAGGYVESVWPGWGRAAGVGAAFLASLAVGFVIRWGTLRVKPS
jgi:hypothetical protein